MAASSHALLREVNDLVLEQISALKHPKDMDDRQLLGSRPVKAIIRHQRHELSTRI